jgi:hypothetical protein
VTPEQGMAEILDIIYDHGYLNANQLDAFVVVLQQVAADAYKRGRNDEREIWIDY